MIDKIIEELEWQREAILSLSKYDVKLTEARADILRAIQKLEKIKNGKEKKANR